MKHINTLLGVVNSTLQVTLNDAYKGIFDKDWGLQGSVIVKSKGAR